MISGETMVSTNEFLMHGAHAAVLGGWSHIEAQVQGLERATAENPSLAFDLAKTVVESACRTILSERKISFIPDDDLPKLFRAVTANLPLLPPSAAGAVDARKSLAQTLNGLHSALQGICELRNAYGFASHGAEGPRPAMESIQALLVAQAADAIVGFLFRVHRQDPASPSSPRLEYVDNEAFNAYVDDANGPIHIFDLEYSASEVLFSIDQEAYRDILAAFEPHDADSGEKGAAAEMARHSR